jgi:hypothetical protein
MSSYPPASPMSASFPTFLDEHPQSRIPCAHRGSLGTQIAIYHILPCAPP